MTTLMLFFITLQLQQGRYTEEINILQYSSAEGKCSKVSGLVNVLNVTFMRHFCDSFCVTAPPSPQQHKPGPGAPESPAWPYCGGVAFFTISWLALSECQAVHVCDPCLNISPSFRLYCPTALTALVKVDYNLQGEPATHLGRIKKQFRFMFQRVNSSVNQLFELHVHTYSST